MSWSVVRRWDPAIDKPRITVFAISEMEANGLAVISLALLILMLEEWSVLDHREIPFNCERNSFDSKLCASLEINF